MKQRRPTGYDKGQHQSICNVLRVSDDPNGPGKTALEAVCELLDKIDRSKEAKTLEEAKKILQIERLTECFTAPPIKY